MGFFRKKGWQCEPMENGVQKCVRFEAGNKEKNATGTEFSYFVDENCDSHPTGNVTILDSDKDDAKEIMNEASASCRRGIH